MTEIVFRAVKVGLSVIGGGATAIVAQTQLPDPGTVGNFGLVAVLALIIGRYTFRQLEDYRIDLKAARKRIDELEADLHQLGRSKGRSERARREAEDYAHKLRATLIAAGVSLDELPPIPESMML